MSPAQPPAADASFAGNIVRFFLYTAIKGFGFGLFGALWIVYLQRERGLSLRQAAWLDATLFVAATLGEVPTGILADRLGRKRSLSIGAATMGLSTLGWVLAPTVAWVVAAYACLGLGFTFVSGVDDALLFESMRRAGRADAYTQVAGRAAATMTVALAAGSVASGLLASIHLTLPFFVDAGCYALLFAIVQTFREPVAESDARASWSARKFASTLKAAVALIRTRAALRYSMLYLAVVPVGAFILETLLVQPQAAAFDVPVAGIGAIVMSLQITGAIGAASSEPLARRAGETAIVWTAPVLITGGLVLLAGFRAPPALALIAVVSFVTAVQRPILFGRIQVEVPDDVRATVLSIESLVSTALAGATQVGVGALADCSGLPATYAALAVVVGVPSLLLLVGGRRHFRGSLRQPSPLAALP